MVKSPDAGFQFDLAKRNAYLEAKGMKAPAPWKTGTTIAGIIFKVRARLCSHMCGISRVADTMGGSRHYGKACSVAEHGTTWCSFAFVSCCTHARPGSEQL